MRNGPSRILECATRLLVALVLCLGICIGTSVNASPLIPLIPNFPLIDCNSNGVEDTDDITAGTSQDCNLNGIPDECDITSGFSQDCNTNNVPDSCDITVGTAKDCNGNLIPDTCEILAGGSDCNNNNIIDSCEVLLLGATDCNGNLVPDECDTDCDSNGAIDECEITADPTKDCDVDGILDLCEYSTEYGGNAALDCDGNFVLDSCQITANAALDCDTDGILDSCETDTDSDGTIDDCDTDDDNDGVLDGADTDSLDPNICEDSDSDGCDDCSVGTDGFGLLADNTPANDGTDTDGDGLCDGGDPDIDGDGALNAADSDDFNVNVCSDTDGDGCDDCSGGSYDPSADGTDTDSDGLCDSGDTDDDNDGVLDGADTASLDPNICGDSDGDGCDDCSVGTDDFGPLADNTPANDGTDTDSDGLCDSGDPDLDGDGIANECDVDQTAGADCNSNGKLDSCETCDTDVYVSTTVAADGVDNFADIASAYAAVCAGGTVHVAAGTYAETIAISDANAKDGITIDGAGATTIVTGGVQTSNTGAVAGMTFSNMTVRGSAAGQSAVFEMDNSGSITDLTLDGVVIDGEGTAGRHGFLGQGIIGTFTVTNSTIENINNWAAMDTDSGGGAGDNGLTAFVFTNNTIRNNEGAVALRGCQVVGALTSTATITGNSISSMNGNYPGGVADYDGDTVADDLGWAGIEVNHVDTVTITGNTISDMRNGYSLFATGGVGDPFDGNYNMSGLGGQSLQVWKVNTLNMSGNTITNNFQGVKIYGSDSVNTDRLIPAGSVTGNTISGNTGFGLMVTDNFNNDAPLDASCNYWGSDDGPEVAGENDATAKGEVYGNSVIGDVTYALWRVTDVNGACTGGDCDGNTIHDFIDIAGGAADCNSNQDLDSCETCDTDVYVSTTVAADGVDNFADIASAYAAVCAGGTVHVAAGTYSAELILSDATVKDGITIDGAGATTILSGGVKTTHSVAVNGMTFSNMTIRHSDGTAGEGLLRMDNGGFVTNLSLDGVTFDGQGIAGVHGILGQGLIGTVTVTGCTLENIANWAVLDSDSGGGAGDVGLTAFVFTDNIVRNNDGGIALRGCQVGG